MPCLHIVLSSLPKKKGKNTTHKMIEKADEEEEENASKPPPSFNGALSKFMFSAPLEKTNANNVMTQTTARKRTNQARKQELGDKAVPATARKKRRKHTGYAPPSAYAHLSGIPDALSRNLICVFIGFNPGVATAIAGHSYASPTNSFWRLLHSSGCTADRQLPPSMDEHLPALYSLGHTNLVSRPSRNVAELSKEEMADSVPELEEKIRKWRPEAVCLVGKAIWEVIWRTKTGSGIKKGDFNWGWQDMRFASENGWVGSRAFVVPSTSGLVAGYSPEFKRAIWKELGNWVQERRCERGNDTKESKF